MTYRRPSLAGLAMGPFVIQFGPSQCLSHGAWERRHDRFVKNEELTPIQDIAPQEERELLDTIIEAIKEKIEEEGISLDVKEEFDAIAQAIKNGEIVVQVWMKRDRSNFSENDINDLGTFFDNIKDEVCLTCELNLVCEGMVVRPASIKDMENFAEAIEGENPIFAFYTGPRPYNENPEGGSGNPEGSYY